MLNSYRKVCYFTPKMATLPSPPFWRVLLERVFTLVVVVGCLGVVTDAALDLQPGLEPGVYLNDQCGTDPEGGWIRGFYDVHVYSQRPHYATYFNNVHCTIHILVTENYGIKVTFHRFALTPPDGGICQDYVEVVGPYNVGARNESVTGKICGDKLSRPYYLVFSNYAKMTFHTDANDTARGFYVSYHRQRISEADRDKYLLQHTYDDDFYNKDPNRFANGGYLATMATASLLGSSLVFTLLVLT